MGHSKAVARSRWAAIGAAIAIALGGGGIGIGMASGDAGSASGSVFHVIEPCRLVERARTGAARYPIDIVHSRGPT